MKHKSTSFVLTKKLEKKQGIKKGLSDCINQCQELHSLFHMRLNVYARAL